MSCSNIKISKVKINYLLALMRSKGYEVFKKPYQLNIIGIRSKNTNPIRFDDSLYVIWKNDKFNWEGKEYAITTDPSTAYLTKEDKKGVAVLPSGQYLNKFTVGKHKGDYRALVQSRPICVYRDFDRNPIINFNTKDLDCGLFGINIHRAKNYGADDGQGNTNEVGLYSAGCQVFQNYYCYQEFMKLIEKQQSIYGNKYFSYTLVDLWTVNKANLKRNLYIISMISGISVLAYGIITKLKKK